jgi:hypothetical protein
MQLLLAYLEAHGRELMRQVDCVRNGEAHVAVEHQWKIFANRIPPLLVNLDVLP